MLDSSQSATSMQAQMLSAEGLDPELRIEPAPPEFPSQSPVESAILSVPLAPSHDATPATASSLRRTTSSIADSFSRRSFSWQSCCVDIPAAVEVPAAAICHSVGTAGPNEAPCTTPEEEEYPDWWDAGPKQPANYEFVPVRSFDPAANRIQ
jgi:hypothetical protein